MADFDMIRDRTLLFFLEHLMGKGQSRTLHDLSCQFGAKGFTKEMRQIAGGSQSGLKKFLAQFPSLFTINGENVFISPLASNNNGSASRDYTKETVQFFSDKLVTYGIAEVPLKSLFGHRSQATSEVRHVSGQNVKEFKDFLCAQGNIFVVRDDYVVLKSVLDQLEQEGHNQSELKRMPEEVTFDPYLMRQLIGELEETLFSLAEQYSETISIDFLFNAIQSKEKQPLLWSNFVQMPSDLITFLHMNSRIFLVQGNMVSLTVERKQTLMEKKANSSIDSTPLLSLNSSDNNPDTKKPEVSSSQTKATTNQGVSSTTSPKAAAAQNFNQRIRSQIIKIVSDNLQYDQSVSSNNPGGGDSIDSSNQFSDSPYDSLDLQLIKPKIIVTNRECKDLLEEIGECCSEVAFDIEGVNLGASGEVTLVQLAVVNDRTSTTKIYIFDVLLNQSLLDNGLRQLFESETIVKISHDVRNNSVSLYKNFGITLKNVFDTQVAHLVLQQQNTGKPAYKPTKYISLYTLCSLYGGPNLNPKLKDKLHKIYKKDFKYWQKRPLTDEMVQFAMTDVYALLPTIYRTMDSQIRPEYRPLFEQLVYESIFANIHTDEIKQIKKQRKFELELTDLKVKLFNNDKKKIVLSNREIRLLRYVDITDEVRNKIEGPQNVAKKLKRFEHKKNGTEMMNGSVNGDKNPAEAKSKQNCELSDEDGGGYESDDEELDEETENESLFNSHEYLLQKQQQPVLCCRCSQRINEVTTGSPGGRVDMSTQTMSTGDIVITKIHINEP